MKALRRIDGERYSEILPVWVGGVVVIIAGGPSVTPEQVAVVERAKTFGRVSAVIAVNDSYLLAPFADICYFADSHWWKWHQDGVDKPALGMSAAQVRAAFAAFAGQKCSIQDSGANITDDAVHIIRNMTFPDHGNLLSTDPRKLATGRNSGFQAMNLAILGGAKVLPLLGFDAQPAEDGKKHWHGDHPPRIGAPGANQYEYFRRAFAEAESLITSMGVTVFNCSPRTAIDAFPKCPIERVFGL